MKALNHGNFCGGSAMLRLWHGLGLLQMVGFKARVQRTVRVTSCENRKRVQEHKRERARGRASSFELSGFGPAHRRLVESVSVWGGAPPMSMVSDDFGLRYLIFHSFRERYTQAIISVVTYVMMMPKFNGYQHHL